MNRRSYGILAAVAFSLACLWFFRAFRKLLFPSDHRYYDLAGPSFSEYAAVLCCVLIVFAVFLLILILATKIKSRVEHIFALGFLGLGLAAFGSLSSEIITWFSPTTNRFVNLPVPIIIFVVCVVLAFRKGLSLKTVTDNLVAVALIALPFGALLSANTLYRMATGGEAPLLPASIESPIDPNAITPPAGRIIWIIFDELDWATLTNMPHDSDVSAFNELMETSFVAENAYSPDFDTRDSIPALLTGKLIDIANTISASDISLVPQDGGKPVSLKTTDTIFTDAHNAGYRSSITGWAHPYPRLFENKVTNAYWMPVEIDFCATFDGCVVRTIHESLESIPGIMRIFPRLRPHENTISSQYDLQSLRVDTISAEATHLIDRPDTGMLFFHFPVPHRPYIDTNGKPGNYIDCVHTANRMLRDVIDELKKTDTFDETTIIVSADHWWRAKSADALAYINDSGQKKAIASDIRIPFIVKMRGDNTHVAYEPEFNTVITRKMIDAIMSGEIKTHADISGFIDRIALEEPNIVGFQPAQQTN